MKRKTSLKDIAQAVGVSTTLVSYVLNNQKENRISKEVAHKIRQAAQALNYQPNQIAKSLKTNKTRTLGLIVADIANPFSAALARVIEDEADQQQYTVIFGSSDENPDKCRKLIATLLNRQVDGLLIAPPAGTESQLQALQQQHVPLVLIDRYLPDLKTSYVSLDNHQAMRTATQHLIDSGYRKIGLITFETSLFHIQERSRGYWSALQENKLPLEESWVKKVSSARLSADVGEAIEELTAGPQAVDALLFASNTLTLTGLKYLKMQPRPVSRTPALVGFDESEAYDLLDTALTYIEQPIQELGQLATRILLETLTTPNRVTQVNLEARLIIQASTPARARLENFAERDAES